MEGGVDLVLFHTAHTHTQFARGSGSRALLRTKSPPHVCVCVAPPPLALVVFYSLVRIMTRVSRVHGAASYIHFLDSGYPFSMASIDKLVF